MPMLMVTTPTALAAPHASAATGDGQMEGQAICDLIPAVGRALGQPKNGCRWSALPERNLLNGEVVELTVQSVAGDVERAALVEEQVRYIRGLQNSHLFANVSEFNPCPNNGFSGRKIRVYRHHHVEHYGYAQCGDRIVRLRVHLLKTGGTDPSTVFDNLANLAGPIFALNN
ncbi:hypothetical protein [Sphingorhabdus sp.]|uniref:hypothetical protein n=1 Tax=Sphingorhabdus sp. TaxID=1902408 RepID=UPI003BB0B7D4|nr:hypothetical protein [Sphingomonadales bacterium]